MKSPALGRADILSFRKKAGTPERLRPRQRLAPTKAIYVTASQVP
jgi:hypothetical protein